MIFSGAVLLGAVSFDKDFSCAILFCLVFMVILIMFFCFAKIAIIVEN
jgi:hypothetical protein